MGPRVKTDVSGVATFGAVLLLEPGAAVLAAVVGLVTYTGLLRFRGDRIRVPWYKFPFNAGMTSLCVGLSSLVLHSLASAPSSDSGVLTLAAIPAAITFYLVNTTLVSVTVFLQIKLNPLTFWWAGTKQSGLAEVSLFMFAYLGALGYAQSPWTIAVMIVPVSIIYLAFARLAQKIQELEHAEQLRAAELDRSNEQLARSRRRIVNAQEELRKGVAQHLHGQVQNRLLVATHWLNAAQDEMGSIAPKSVQHLKKAAQLVQEINNNDIRSAVQRLHPSLIRMSLQASLRSLADEFHNTFQVEVDVDDRDTETAELWRTGLTEESRLAIYRVAEEALSNTLKYASATRVELTLNRPSQDRITMTIRDNGNGFNVESTTFGFGLLSMQDYCGAIGGKVDVTSKIGQGTTIQTSFPIAVKETSPVSHSQVALFHETAEAIASEGPDGKINGAGYATKHKPQVATTLLIVDDQPDFCGLVKELLKPYPDFEIAAVCHSGLNALRLIDETKPDVVLLDLEMPGISGLETARAIQDRFPSVTVLLMSAFHERGYIDQITPGIPYDFIHKAEFSVNRLRYACNHYKEAQRVLEPSLR